MNNLGNVKIFGGIGALLLLIGGFIPYAGPIVSIVGLVLVFIAVKSISELTKNNDIFKNYLIHFLLSIVTIVVVFAVMIIAFGASGGFSWINQLQTANITDIDTFWEYFGTMIGACALALIIGWILSIIAAIYLRRSYNAIAEHTEVNLFKTTGTVYFIGALTSIILIGLLISSIGRIIEIIAYFSLPDEIPGETKKEKNDRRCPGCNRIIPEDANSCPYCEKKF